MILADKIIHLRKKMGWSQEELAEEMNVSRQAVSKWESAQSVPDLAKILQLSALFCVTTDYLLKDEIEAEELLEVICKVTENLDVFGYLYDVDEEEYGFSSEKGDSYYVNSRRAKSFNDELDAVALDEEALADD